MISKLVHQRARQLRAKTRRKMLGTLAGPVAVGFFYTIGLKLFPTLQEILHPPFAFALAWSFAGLFVLNRRMWSAVMPGDAGLNSGLQFCRLEVERQRDLVRRGLIWSFGPILLAIGAFIWALATVGTRDRGILPNGLPFLSLVVIWIIAYFIIRVREQRDLQREIVELEDIERDNRAA